MRLHRIWFRHGLVLLALAGLTCSCAYRRKKYENPITKDTQQPDKVLFDKAVRDIERGRYEIARLTLNTMMNTYDQSEFLAKAKLAIADSWYREAGTHGLAQAEAEYKDFILFYPMMEESAEAQEKVCMIHVKQMEKPDRDPMHAQRAEEECRTLLTQFPNSKFAPQGQQILRDIQEALAEKEFRVGTFYHTKGIYFSAANRLQGLVDHFALFSRSDEALWMLGDSYGRMGPKFRDKAAAAYARLVEKYPLSPLVPDAKKKLKDMEKPIPEPDPVALAWQKYELANQKKNGMMSHFWGIFSSRPDTSQAAKSGQPPMDSFQPQIPVTVPITGTTAGADVTATTVGSGSSALDTLPDARQGKQDSQASSQDQTNSAPPKNKKKK